MLVLSRKVDDAILIGSDVKVIVLAIDGDRVKLGVEAPKTTRIFRYELLQETKSVNREAADAPLVIFNHIKDKKE